MTRRWLKIALAVIFAPLGVWRLIQGSWLGVIYPTLWMSALFSFPVDGTPRIHGAWLALPALIALSAMDIRSSARAADAAPEINVPQRMAFVGLGMLLQGAVLVVVMVLAIALGLLVFPHSLR